jgi:RraA family protein
MPIGFRIFPDFKRPDKALIEQFAGIPSSNIGDCMERLYCMYGGLRPYNKKLLLGPAFTVKVPAGDNLVIHKALDYAKPGDIIVVDGAGALDRALVGAMMISYGRERGIAGFVIDGCIRDVDDIYEIGIPVYARGVTPQGPYKHGPGEINVPIVCCGQIVCPGDILVGDADGIVVIRPEYAQQLADICREKHNQEKEKLNRQNTGNILIQEHINRFDEAFKDAGGEICTFK